MFDGPDSRIERKMTVAQIKEFRGVVDVTPSHDERPGFGTPGA